MLRAYNAEAENCVRTLKAGNIEAAKKRLNTAATQIEKLGSMMEMRINPRYHALRLEELELVADYQIKLQEEREAAREERARLREERRVQAELDAEKERLEKERNHLLNALTALQESPTAENDGNPEEELGKRLNELEAAIEANDYRRTNIRAGYIYVISNPGAFGYGVIKIGLTRRLEPKERVTELGDSSVPFPFAVHLLHYSDDTVTLERELHESFAERRLNHVNLRREFFFATPEEVRNVLREKMGALLEFHEEPEADQFLQSVNLWPENARRFDVVPGDQILEAEEAAHEPTESTP